MQVSVENSNPFQVSVENIGSLGRKLTVLVPAQRIQSKIQERMAELSNKAQVSGFRPGNIPKKILEQKFGTQVRQEALGFMIETTLPSILEQQNLKPAGRPIVEEISNENNSDLRYVVTFEVFPEFTVADFSDIQIEKYQVNISEKDVDETIEKLKEQLAEWVEVKRPIKEGDQVIVDYTSTIDGKPYENNTGKDIKVSIGSRLFIEGFEQGLVNASINDEVVLNLAFPSSWRIKKLAGQPVAFTVRIKGISEKRKAELDDEFAKKIGANSIDPATIRNKIKENLESQVKEMITNSLKDQVSDALLKLNPIPLPKALVEREMNALHEDLHRRMGNTPGEACGHQHQGLEAQAERRVALGLILNEVIKNENLKPDMQLVKKRIESLAKMFGNTEYLEKMYYDSEELMSGVRHTVLLDQALDVVVSRAKIIEKPITMEALFNQEGNKEGKKA